MKHKITETNIERLRDPFVITENGTHYMYGTGWVCYKSSDSLEHWTRVEKELVVFFTVEELIYSTKMILMISTCARILSL